MTRKQIDQAREIRLWVSQVVVPSVAAVGMILTIPEVRQTIAAKANEVKAKINNRRYAGK